LQDLFKSEQERVQVLERKLNAAELAEVALQSEATNRTAELEKLSTQLEDVEIQLNESSDSLIVSKLAEKAASSKLEERSDRLAALNNEISEVKGQLAEARDSLQLEQGKVADFDKLARANEVRADELEKKNKESCLRYSELIAKYEALQEVHNKLDREFAEASTALHEREENLAQQAALFEQQKASLAAQFKELVSEELESNRKKLQDTSQQSVSALMTPFKSSIDSFKKEVQEIHHRDGLQQGELRKELQGLKDLNHKLSTEAHELSTALKGQKKLQGNWGELVLENVLDRSGLQKDRDYRREVSVTTEDGRLRPDVVVDLPEGKHLVIDSKVSLNAYTRFINADDDVESAIALKEHVKAIGERINELADKEYGKLPGLNSPEMVFMFVPIESAFVEAFKADESLFQTAIDKNVLVATPTTLLTSLNIVRQLWRFEEQNKHSELLAGKAEAVFNKLNSFLKSFIDIKKGIDKASDAFLAAEGKLVNGRGNLVKQVGEFKRLAPSIKGELPERYLDRAALELALDEPVTEGLQKEKEIL